MIKFSTPAYANIALDCKILLSQVIFCKLVFNGVCKSIWCFWYYSYRYITVQYIEKMIFGQWWHEYSWQNCQENLFQKYILCKKNHKVWNRKYLNEKVEIERIAKKTSSNAI